MTRKPPAESTPEVAAPLAAAPAHPLPSEGGSYVIEAGELRQVADPTSPDIANAPLIKAPVTEA